MSTDSAAPPRMNPDVRRPRRGRGPSGPVGFVLDSLLMGWRWLVRMRTALLLLLALGLQTLLATVVPQEPNVPGTVEAWRAGAEGPGVVVSRAIDVVGGYDVYGSALFLALLLLLYLSLTACLIPRIRGWIRLVRRSRPPLTRHAARQEHVAQLTTDADPAAVHDAAASLLTRRRWRVRTEDDQVAAEKGLWSREGGSLLFHLSFYALLAAIVFGQLLGFDGQRAVVEGESFADTPVSYWTYGPGRWWNDDDHRGWVLALDDFEVDWVRDPLAPGAGQPTVFTSDVTVTTADGEVSEAVVAGNQPLTIEGRKVHQLDWGYAPFVEVWVDGVLEHAGFLTAQASDGGMFRAAVKVPSAEPDVGLEVFFWPHAPDSADGPVFTGVPWVDEPLLLFRQYRGDLRIGRTQQTINELDTTALESVGGGLMRPGGEVTMDDGVTVRFVELRRWVGFQVSARPQIPWLLVASAMLLGGLHPALYAYRRRLWVVASRPDDGGRTLVTVAGRAFQRPQAFEEEHAEVARRLAATLDADPVPPTPDDAVDDEVVTR